jgi:hypothetical protein
MKGLFVALLLVLLQARIGVCQFNDSINYYANLSSTGILNKTNNGNSYVLNNSFRFNIYKKSVAINTINSWMFGKNQERLTNNDYTAGLDVNLFKNERHVYYWALANYEKSYSLKINYRLQSGGGVGYYILDKADFVVQISDGILYETSDLYDAENTANEFEILRNSFRLKFRVTGWNVLTLEGSDFIQHALADKHDYIIRSNTNLSVKLRKWLSITLAVNYNKLSVTGRDNFLLNYGLTIEKYF